MLRQRLPVRIPVPGRDVPDAAAELTAAVERMRRPRPVRGDLRVRVRPGGEVRVRQVSGEHVYHPHVDGRLEQEDDGQVWLVGRAVEHAGEVFVVAFWGFLALCMALMTAVTVVDGEALGAIVCAAGAVAFGVLTWLFQRGRRSFPDDVEELMRVLAAASAGSR
ncbi:hypothetical protein [Blastococcus sp. LR1]|uniref:hypothetical protein n=1 Tax=Blastococcus sp. LR1 TaxID=2877000 RepID=UPI001CCE2FCA|nr:hypothetical protein [Blastococcus sp. LR1]MCA0147114.1 hypothetical protein [Blastococcus sp. LR1]